MHKHEQARAGFAGGMVERVSEQIAGLQDQVVAENFRHCVPRGAAATGLHRGVLLPRRTLER